MKTLKLIVLVTAVFSMTACNFDFNLNQTSGSGNVETEERNVTAEFNQVHGSAGIDVYLTEGDELKIVVEADDNLIPMITTEINNGKLKIGVEKGKNIGRAKAKKVHVTYKSLNSITASSGADVIGNSVVRSDALTLGSSSGADLEVDIIAKEVYADVSSGADLKIAGRAIKLVAEASSGSDLKAKDLEVRTCKANASSGADITVNVIDELDGKASSGGDIKYYGDPTAVKTKDGASGSVRKM